MWSLVVLGGEYILNLFIGVMAAGLLVGVERWLLLGCLKCTSSMLKSIGDIWFGCSREVCCFSEGLLVEVLNL